MKVLILLSRCDQTGMTTNTLDLCEGLSDLGHEIILVVGKAANDDKVAVKRYNDFLSLGIKVKRFCEVKGKLSRLFAILQILFFLTFIKSDIIHVESPYLTFCPWLLRKKFTSTFHVNDLISCFYFKKATHLIAISRETKDYAIKNFGFKEKDITIVNHGVSKRFSVLADVLSKEKIKIRYHIPQNKILIGLVGSIEKRKGHHVLLSALRMCPKEDIERIHVVFCGSSKFDDENRNWLYDNIESSLGWGHVTHIEYTDPKDIYDILDITVLPSSLEGFLLVAIESMMSGVCTVRTDTEGASEQIINGVTGVIFRTGDDRALSKILHKLISNEEQRKRIAAAGREFALARFTAKKMAESTVQVYKRIIDDY